MKFISEILLLAIFGVSLTFAVNMRAQSSSAEDPFPNGKVPLTSEDPNANMHKGGKPQSGYVPPAGGTGMAQQDQESCCGKVGENKSAGLTIDSVAYQKENFQLSSPPASGSGGSSSSSSGQGVKKNK